MEFPFRLGLARLLHGAARVQEGESGALADMEAALGMGAETGSRADLPSLFSLLAEAHLIAGKPAEAQGMAETGLAVAADTGQHTYDAELHRLQAEIVLALGGASDDAESALHRALEISRAQEAKSFELRAAMSLARLWQRQGKRDAARALLAPLYAWFTEGFATRDLKDAKALLVKLG